MDNWIIASAAKFRFRVTEFTHEGTAWSIGAGL